ncbi:MAG TPA: hypothetical protein VGM56_02890 [Byssovorax sp.]
MAPRPFAPARRSLSSTGRASIVAASVAALAAIAPAACNALTGVGDYQFGDFTAAAGGASATSSTSPASTGSHTHTASASHGAGGGGMEPCGGAPGTGGSTSTGHGGASTATATSSVSTTTTTGGAGGGNGSGGGAPAMCSGRCGCCNCDDYLHGRSVDGTLCQGSQNLGLELGVCVCEGNTTCYQAGNGGGGPTGACADLCTTQALPPSDACLQCAQMTCHQQYNACEDDPG